MFMMNENTVEDYQEREICTTNLSNKKSINVNAYQKVPSISMDNDIQANVEPSLVNNKNITHSNSINSLSSSLNNIDIPLSLISINSDSSTSGIASASASDGKLFLNSIYENYYACKNSFASVRYGWFNKNGKLFYYCTL